MAPLVASLPAISEPSILGYFGQTEAPCIHLQLPFRQAFKLLDFCCARFSACSLPVALCLTSRLAHTERMGRDTNKVYLLKTCQGDAKSSPGKPSWPSKQSNTMQRGLPTPLKRACPHSVFLVSVGVMNELPVQLLRLPNNKRDMPTDHTFVAICSFSRHCRGQ